MVKIKNGLKLGNLDPILLFCVKNVANLSQYRTMLKVKKTKTWLWYILWYTLWYILWYIFGTKNKTIGRSYAQCTVRLKLKTGARR